MIVNEEKRKKFLNLAEARVQNVIHTMEIIVPMAKSPNYDYTEDDVNLMMTAIKDSYEKLEIALREKFTLEATREKSIFKFETARKVNKEIENYAKEDVSNQD